MATLAQLGARTLRKLGVSVVAYADQPAVGQTMTTASVVSDVLRNRGIYVAEADRPAQLQSVGLTDLGARTARAVGINPVDLIAVGSGLTFDRNTTATKVLLKLAVIASDETPIAQDQALAVDKIVAVHDGLVAMDLVTWSVDAIPASVVEYYITMAANLAAPEFGKPASLDALNGARDTIRVMALSGARGQFLAEQKVQAAHDGLNVLGLVSWPVSAVPVAFAENYVAIAAAQLSPTMGKPADKEAAVNAEARIRHAGMVRGATDRATRSVQAVHAELQGMGLVSWDANSIPASMAKAYVMAATASMGDEDGKPFDAAAYSAQMMRVRMLAMGGPAGQALAEQKIRAVHYKLDSQGRTRWTLWDLPDFAEEPYVLMAATLLAPEVSMKADPAWDVQAQMDLIRANSIPTNHAPVRAPYF